MSRNRPSTDQPDATGAPVPGRLSPAADPPPRAGGRRAPGVPDLPLPEAAPRRLRWFTLMTVAIAAVVVLVVAGFNAVVDPYGMIGTAAFPTVTWTDRALKVYLVGNLRAAPDTVILGSSRAMKFEPDYVAEKTGAEDGFNAAVSSGRPIDAWAFVNLIHDRWPDDSPAYLWLLDVEAFRPWPPDPGLLSTPKLARYLPEELQDSLGLDDLKLLVSWETASMSLRSIQKALRDEDPGASTDKEDFAADGFRIRNYQDDRLAAGRPLAAGVRYTRRLAEKTYREGYDALDPGARRFFTKTVELMNEQGATPVIVLSPQHPDVTDGVEKLGWGARRQELLDFLAAQQEEHDLIVLDYTDITSFGGSPDDFYDGYHLTVPNTQRLVDAVLDAYPDALR